MCQRLGPSLGGARRAVGPATTGPRPVSGGHACRNAFARAEDTSRAGRARPGRSDGLCARRNPEKAGRAGRSGPSNRQAGDDGDAGGPVMAGAPSRGVWKQLDGLFRFGVSGQLGDDELLGRFVAGRRDEAARGGVRGPGGAARADGPGRLPPRAGRPARGRGRVPGDVPGPGARPARSRAASNWPTGSTASPAARRSTPGRAPTAAGRGSGRRFAMSPAEAGPDDAAGARRAARDPRRGAGPAAGLVSRRRGPLRARRPVAPGGRAAARHPRGDALQPARPGQGPAAPSPDPPGPGPFGRRARGRAGARGPRRPPPALAGGFHHPGRGAGRGRCLPGRGRFGLGRRP